MVYGELILLGYCKVWHRATPDFRTIEYSCLDEKAKPPKGGDAKQQGLPLRLISQDSLLPNQQGSSQPSTVWLADRPVARRSFCVGRLAGEGNTIMERRK